MTYLRLRRGLVALGVASPCLAAFAPMSSLAAADPTDAPAKSKWVAASLTGVSVAPHSKSAWAIGLHSTRSGNQASYAVRRHGSQWSSVKTVGGTQVRLLGIAASSPKSIWAVGLLGFGDTSEPVVEHSTGGAFTRVKANFPSGDFSSVATSSPSNVWAVGAPPPFSSGQPVVARWNGKTWRTIDDSGQHGYGTNAVSTSGRRNVWILGTKSRRATAGFWDGHSMTVIPIPTPPNTALQSIATTGPKDTWVVGWVARHGGRRLKTFTTHWNGKTWKHVNAPSPSHESQATSVSAAGKRVYLAGVGLRSLSSSNQTPYLERLVHGRWKVVHTPSRSKSSNLSQVSVSSKSGAAVGFYATKTPGGQPTELPFAATLRGTTWRGGTAPR